MKKSIIFCVILFLLIIAGLSTCRTQIEYITPDYVLPEEPQRHELRQPSIMTSAAYLEIIAYYEALVQEWEAWAVSVKGIIEPDLEITP